MDASPKSVTSSFRRAGEQPVVSGLGLSSCLEESAASGHAPPQLSSAHAELAWKQPRPSRRELWRLRHGLGGPSSMERPPSFGSLSTMSKRQIAEVSRGMAESGHPFLWVLRKDNRSEIDGDDSCSGIDSGAGMVVEWCDQGKVLSHPVVGCFVTHCGRNSTLESVACGVPMVGVPQWTDQGTNAWLVERKLGTGVRAAVSEKDSLLEADELRRCIGFATSNMVRAKAALWREKARAAAAVGGSSERNLRAFVAGN